MKINLPSIEAFGLSRGIIKEERTMFIRTKDGIYELTDKEIEVKENDKKD